MRKLSLILLLLVLVLSPCYSDYSLTEVDYWEQVINQHQQSRIFQELTTKSENLTIQVDDLITASTMHELELEKSETDSKLLETQLQTLQLSVDRAQDSHDEEIRYYKRQNIYNLLVGTAIGSAIIGGLWLYCELK